jgi:hypothetical protein
MTAPNANGGLASRRTQTECYNWRKYASRLTTTQLHVWLALLSIIKTPFEQAFWKLEQLSSLALDELARRTP